MSDAAPPPKLGALVRERRHEAGLTLRALASRTGLSAVDLGRIERGVWAPPNMVLSQLFASLHEIGASPEDGFAAVAHLVQEIPRRCAIKGCRARPEVMVAMADQAGIIGGDSLSAAASCRGHHRDVAEILGRSIVAARIKHDYPDAVRADIGSSIGLGPRDGGAAS